MHSKIFQITEERPLKDNILNDCTLEQETDTIMTIVRRLTRKSVNPTSTI